MTDEHTSGDTTGRIDRLEDTLMKLEARQRKTEKRAESAEQERDELKTVLEATQSQLAWHRETWHQLIDVTTKAPLPDDPDEVSREDIEKGVYALSNRLNDVERDAATVAEKAEDDKRVYGVHINDANPRAAKITAIRRTLIRKAVEYPGDTMGMTHTTTTREIRSWFDGDGPSDGYTRKLMNNIAEHHDGFTIRRSDNPTDPKKLAVNLEELPHGAVSKRDLDHVREVVNG